MKTTLFIAISLDGYIAGPNGAIDWLDSFQSQDNDYGYTDFYKDIDLLMMGRNTYEQVKGFGSWVYENKMTYVFSSKPIDEPRTDIKIISEVPANVMATLDPDSRIWLVGGAKLVHSFMKQGLIDEYFITIVPKILGEGIGLFSGGTSELDLNLTALKRYENGVVQLIYAQKNQKK